MKDKYIKEKHNKRDSEKNWFEQGKKEVMDLLAKVEVIKTYEKPTRS